MKKEKIVCPKCAGTRWKTKSKKDRKYECRDCGFVKGGA